jgi:hypothetical protein
MSLYSLQLLIVVTSLVFLNPLLANAEKSSISDKITKNIKEICLAPSDKGKYWDTRLKAGGETNVKLRFLGKASAEASFNAGEWEGVQKVLQSQQAHDNANYRDCVKKLTPLFLEKFVHNNQPKTILPLKIGKAFEQITSHTSYTTQQLQPSVNNYGNYVNINGSNNNVKQFIGAKSRHLTVEQQAILKNRLRDSKLNRYWDIEALGDAETVDFAKEISQCFNSNTNITSGMQFGGNPFRGITINKDLPPAILNKVVDILNSTGLDYTIGDTKSSDSADIVIGPQIFK